MGITDKLERLTQLGLQADVLKPYDQPHRFYHTISHLDDVWGLLEKQGFGENDALLLTTVFHDIVYDPRSSTNEEDSAAFFEESFTGDPQLKAEVVQMILDTKTHLPQTELSRIFCNSDLAILKRPFAELLVYEEQIFKEFQFVDHKIYRERRAEVLETLKKSVDNPALDDLIAYVKFRKPNIAVYPGSFNPFHKGHLNILQKAERIFDKVIIAQGINPGKDVPNVQLPDQIKFRQTEQYQGMLTDFVNSLGYNVTVIRGLRNGSDLQYELNQYRYLQELSDKQIKVISIFCDSEFEHISSTGIRQLEKYGKAGPYLLGD